MIKSELITPQHLSRKAIVYIRQSTSHQVITNQESLKLQYALKNQALEFGWTADNIITIDNDLGLTGSAAEHREGFKEVVAQVTLEKVGIILSYDVTRLSRNCSDWYPLLDICGYRNCLIGDREGVYDPSTINGRLLLGLKGQLAEMELSTIRARLNAGLLNKAKRGDLALQLPTGLLRNELEGVHKDPNLEIQAAITRVFATFLNLRAASKTVSFLKNNDGTVPRYNRWKEVIWKKPTIASVMSILKNPAYAGVFAYGKTQTIRTGPTSQDKKQKKVGIENYKVFLKDKYPAYISWKDFEKIQNILKENYAEYDRNKTRGIPRKGEALLQGIVYCGECGHKMVIQYKSGTRYLCNYHRQQYRESVCQFIPARAVDEWVVQAFFQAMTPIELNAYEAYLKNKDGITAENVKADTLRVERLRYQSELAERQFNRVDPDNRLVASTLEKKWEQSLHDLKEAKDLLDKRKEKEILLPPIPEDLKSAFIQLGTKLPGIWDQLLHTQQKSFLRTLIEKVVVHRSKRDCLKIRIVWQGGETTTTELPITVGSFAELSDNKAMEKFIIEHAHLNFTDEEIAEKLTQMGCRSPMKSFVIASTVQTIRLKHKIFKVRSQSHPTRVKGFLSVSQIAKKIGVSNHWIYDRINNDCIKLLKSPHPKKFYLFPDSQKTITLFEGLKKGIFYNLDFLEEHQDV